MNKKTSLIWILLLLVFSSSAAFAEKVYQWKDKNGVVSYTNDEGAIPDEYRAQALGSPSPVVSPGQPLSLPKTPGLDKFPFLDQKNLKDFGQARHDFSRKILESMKNPGSANGGKAIVGVVCYFTGSLVCLIGWIMMLIAAIRVGLIWVFVMLLCCPCGPFILAISHWEVAKKSFLIWLAGVALQAIAYALI